MDLVNKDRCPLYNQVFKSKAAFESQFKWKICTRSNLVKYGVEFITGASEWAFVGNRLFTGLFILDF